MMKAKLVATFAAMIAVLGVSATSSSAWFSSNSNSTAGTITSESEIVLAGGGATLECAGATGEWKIQTKGPILEHEVGEKQVKTLQGPHQYIRLHLNECKAKTAEMKGLTPKVSECELQLVQEKGAFTATGGVATECKIEITVLFLTCKITVPVANEQTGLNFGLKENELTNLENNLLIKANDSGITTEAKGTCPGVSNTKEATVKGTIKEQGVKAE
jgi:hypothetical protein